MSFEKDLDKDLEVSQPIFLKFTRFAQYLVLQNAIVIQLKNPLKGFQGLTPDCANMQMEREIKF